MSLDVLISLKAMDKSTFHHGLDRLHIQCVGTDFSAVHSMHLLMNLTAMLSSSWVAWVQSLLSTSWIDNL